MKVFSTVPKAKHKHDLEISVAKVLPKVERVLMKEHEDAFPLALKFQLSVQVQIKNTNMMGPEINTRCDTWIYILLATVWYSKKMTTYLL